MAHLATRKFTHWGQLGILLALFCGGFLLGMVVSIIPLIGVMDVSEFFKGKSSADIMDAILKPENANALRISQFLSTLFIFFIPCWFYARICHVKPAVHLGLHKRPLISQLVIAGITMFFALMILGAMQEVWTKIPFPDSWKATFKVAEDNYAKQLLAMGRMNGAGDFILSLFIIAFLPAVFEEVFFRGTLQNLLSRTMNGSVWSIVFVSLLFSAIHFSYNGFIPRAMLGFVLGWMYYKTGNLWLSIFGHFINNAIGVVVLYFASLKGPVTDFSKVDQHIPIWFGLVGLVAVIALLFVFEKISAKQIDRPGQEALMPDYHDPKNPFIANVQDSNDKPGES